MPCYAIADRLRIPYDRGGYTTDEINALRAYGVSAGQAGVLSNSSIKNDIAGNKPILMGAYTTSGAVMPLLLTVTRRARVR